MKDKSYKSPGVNQNDNKETSQLFWDKSYLKQVKLVPTKFFSQGFCSGWIRLKNVDSSEANKLNKQTAEVAVYYITQTPFEIYEKH